MDLPVLLFAAMFEVWPATSFLRRWLPSMPADASAWKHVRFDSGWNHHIPSTRPFDLTVIPQFSWSPGRNSSLLMPRSPRTADEAGPYVAPEKLQTPHWVPWPVESEALQQGDYVNFTVSELPVKQYAQKATPQGRKLETVLTPTVGCYCNL